MNAKRLEVVVLAICLLLSMLASAMMSQPFKVMLPCALIALASMVNLAYGKKLSQKWATVRKELKGFWNALDPDAKNFIFRGEAILAFTGVVLVPFIYFFGITNLPTPLWVALFSVTEVLVLYFMALPIYWYIKGKNEREKEAMARQEMANQAVELTRIAHAAKGLNLAEALALLTKAGISATCNPKTNEHFLNLPEVFWFLAPELMADTLGTVMFACPHQSPNLAKMLLRLAKKDPERALAIAISLGETHSKEADYGVRHCLETKAY